MQAYIHLRDKWQTHCNWNAYHEQLLTRKPDIPRCGSDGRSTWQVSKLAQLSHIRRSHGHHYTRVDSIECGASITNLLRQAFKPRHKPNRFSCNTPASAAVDIRAAQ